MTFIHLLHVSLYESQIPFPQFVPHNTMTDIMQKDEELIPKSEAESQASISRRMGYVSGSLTILVILIIGTGL